MVVSLKDFFMRLFGGRRRDDAVPLFVLLVLCGLLLMGCLHSEMGGTNEEKAYDRLQLKGRWSEIIEKNNQQPAQSLACKKVVALAMLKEQGARGKEQELMAFCLSDSHDVLTSPAAALMMSDVYMQLGMVAMAQRAAFEAMVKMGDVKNCERPLRRLTESALIMGQTELTVKYASLLEEFSSSRKWARRMKQLARHPELIDEASGIGKLKKQYEHTEDTFFL